MAIKVSISQRREETRAPPGHRQHLLGIRGGAIKTDDRITSIQAIGHRLNTRCQRIVARETVGTFEHLGCRRQVHAEMLEAALTTGMVDVFAKGLKRLFLSFAGAEFRQLLNLVYAKDETVNPEARMSQRTPLIVSVALPRPIGERGIVPVIPPPRAIGLPMYRRWIDMRSPSAFNQRVRLRTIARATAGGTSSVPPTLTLASLGAGLHAGLGRTGITLRLEYARGIADRTPYDHVDRFAVSIAKRF